MAFRIRRAELADADEITHVLIVAMPGDAEWWDYRFPARHRYPEDHYKFLHLLIQTWIAHTEDFTVMVAECLDGTGKYKIGSYSAWDTTYLGKRKHGPSYEGVSRRSSILSSLSDGEMKHLLKRMKKKSRSSPC